MGDYSLDEFVADLRAVAANNDDVHDILKRLPPFAVRYAASADLKRRCKRNPEPGQGFEVQLLHEEPAALKVIQIELHRGHSLGRLGKAVGLPGQPSRSGAGVNLAS